MPCSPNAVSAISLLCLVANTGQADISLLEEMMALLMNQEVYKSMSRLHRESGNLYIIGNHLNVSIHYTVSKNALCLYNIIMQSVFRCSLFFKAKSLVW